MTKIIIVDTAGKVVGAEEFDTALQQQLIRYIVRVFVFNAQGELFVQHRGATVKIWPNRWDSSAAGHVDPGETPLQAAVREMQEELGIEDGVLTKIKGYYEEEREGSIVLKAFTILYSSIWLQEIKTDGREVAGGRWVSLEQLEKEIKKSPREFSPGFVQALQQYIVQDKIS